jgi:serine/threonine protein phosphatase PrpC
MPNGGSLGLAVSRAFGDYCLKDFGLVSEPEVTYRKITDKDQFLILATDGMWDVMTNNEAVEIVRGVKERRKSAKRLVERAVTLWRRKRRSIAMDDISVLCLFFRPS